LTLLVQQRQNAPHVRAAIRVSCPRGVHFSSGGFVPMSERDVISNQKKILSNQRQIIANQKSIRANQETIKKNQGTILKNQGSLNTIIKNQKQILARLKK
jgi:TolA-binding protein